MSATVDVNQPNELDAASYRDVQTAVRDAFIADQCGNGQLDEGEHCDPEMLGEENPRCLSNCQLNREPVVNNILVQADGEITVGVWVECLFDVSDPDGDQLRTQVHWRVNNQTVAQGRSWQVSSAPENRFTCEIMVDDGYGALEISHEFTVQSRCGDGFISVGEACDDGNQIDADPCTTNCQLPVCGDGVVLAGVEACMTGTSRMTTLVATIVPTLAVVMAFSKWGSKNVMMGMKSLAMHVSMIAAEARCGDGVLYQGVEECDAPNSEGCRTSCVLTPHYRCSGTDPNICVTGCGDGVVDPSEECDVLLSPTQCGADCLAVSACGDGVVNPDEDCDDSLGWLGNGCDGCQFELPNPSCAIVDPSTSVIDLESQAQYLAASKDSIFVVTSDRLVEQFNQNGDKDRPKVLRVGRGISFDFGVVAC